MIDPAGLAAGELNDRCHDDKEKPDTGREQPEDRRALPKLVRRRAFHRKPYKPRRSGRAAKKKNVDQRDAKHRIGS